jgi:DNA ligase-1
MKFSEFAKYLEKLEKTPSRLEITRILTELLKASGPSEIDKVVYLSLGVLAPNYEGVLLNLAEKMILRSISMAYKTDLGKVTDLYKKLGDSGNVAENLAQYRENASLRGHSTEYTVTDVYGKLLEIAKDGGAGSAERKIEKMANLLKEVEPLDARFIARIPVGKLRLGFSEKTIIDALAGHNPKTQGEIESAYNIRPDIGFIAKLVKEGNLKAAKPEVGVPVVPMLAQRLNSTSEMIAKMGEVSVEPKFDGLRIFIHYRKNPSTIKIFTRNMNSIDINTFPELLEVGKFIKADEVILDSEAVGLDPERERFLDFQKTIQRRRKHDIEKNASEIPLQFQVFDILLIDGRSLIETPYIERRRTLEKVIVNGSLLRVDENTITKDPEIIKKYHEKYLKMGLEGVVVKKANGGYVSGRTGWNWVKMKEEEGRKGRMSDTIDAVVMGYFSGKGKRTQFGLGKILVGIKDGDKIRTLTKVGTGLTEEMLVTIRKRLNKLSLPSNGKLESKDKPKEYEAQKDLIPDVWAIPSLIVELSADSISVSTKHSLGLSLRFPRFLRIREDKGPNEATTIKELNNIFELQKK